ncbi:hypothetical protein BDR04DRAFT_1103415 [Suillus decipiens]|nr:hypothetical protein BDR04DRAFT_1103415 [Suillus decipiens]
MYTTEPHSRRHNVQCDEANQPQDGSTSQPVENPVAAEGSNAAQTADSLGPGPAKEAIQCQTSENVPCIQVLSPPEDHGFKSRTFETDHMLCNSRYSNRHSFSFRTLSVVTPLPCASVFT